MEMSAMWYLEEEKPWETYLTEIKTASNDNELHEKWNFQKIGEYQRIYRGRDLQTGKISINEALKQSKIGVIYDVS